MIAHPNLQTVFRIFFQQKNTQSENTNTEFEIKTNKQKHCNCDILIETKIIIKMKTNNKKKEIKNDILVHYSRDLLKKRKTRKNKYEKEKTMEKR